MCDRSYQGFFIVYYHVLETVSGVGYVRARW